MKIASTLLIAGSALALSLGSAFAAEKTAKAASNDPGFNKLDRNNDGYLSRAEAARNPYLVKHFKEADKNGDGKLSREEHAAAPEHSGAASSGASSAPSSSSSSTPSTSGSSSATPSDSSSTSTPSSGTKY